MFKKLGFSVVAVLTSLSVFAAGPDVSAITAILPDIATVGATVFGVYVAIKAVKFVRRAL
ncbi:major capsid protein [Propionivibrio sp.]|uniref:major capsid protein n=1 Tax=Propionivibrio sp. TaxID=2212460 RepID=UPI00260CB648|nr:major capsid protein [Propionivibrio sp.]